MKLIIAFGLIGNLFVLTLLFFQPAESGFESSVARMVVSERIEKLVADSPESTIKISHGCTEQDGSGGTISGRAQSLRKAYTVEGIPVKENTEFSYRAEVDAKCSPYNPNCYGIETMDIEGTRIVRPSL